jgi:predicted translin family RNA/ssDNA-binding protein
MTTGNLRMTIKRCRLVVAVVAVVAGGAACSLDLAYRHADWLIVWQVDHYLDLTSEQKAALGRSLKPFLSRHRAEALPVYEAFLGDVRTRVSGGLNREDLDWIFARYQALRAELLDPLVGDGAVLLTSVHEKQIAHLERALRKDGRKAERVLKLGREERLAKRAAAAIELAEDWLGSLTTQQKQGLTDMSLALPDLQGAWQAYQREAQSGLLQALREHAPTEVLASRLRDWLVFPEHRVPADFQHAVTVMRGGIKEIVIELNRLATPGQRTHLLAKLQSLIDTIHDLRTS